MLFSYCDHLSYVAYVLKVLSQETLETSKEVKNPYVSSPSLAKEVKDSSLTILSNPKPFHKSFVQARRSYRVFLAGSGGRRIRFA
jgi:hypothetical protein